MNVLVVGSGGREHAFVWKLYQSKKVKKIFAAPGNAGMAAHATCVSIQADDIQGLLKFAKDNMIYITIVGPELPLTLGIVDEFQKNNLRIFGPSKAAAQLEGSKIFSKVFMSKYGIPTAPYEIFDNVEDARVYIEKEPRPLVIKADGLAAGKGVYICMGKAESLSALEEIMVKKTFGDAGKRIIVEECLMGQEVSILAFCDGNTVKMMETSQDHKRIFNNDEGPNTGGMGAYSPADLMDDTQMKEIYDHVLVPVLEGMQVDESPFVGILYAGIMLTEKGIKVLEFNVRFGDPEAQVVIPRLKNDLVDVMNACINGNLDQIELFWDERTAVCVVLASEGYPGAYEKGKVITGFNKVEADRSTIVFHAGTSLDDQNKVLTSGGRVIGLTALDKDLKSAIDRCYQQVPHIQFDGMFYRNDIGKKGLQKTIIKE